jgi:hypothetical protein
MRAVLDLRTAAVLSATLILLPALAGAQSGFELTPSIGYRWGGEISAGATDLFAVDMKVAEGTAWGLSLDLPLNHFLQLELMADHQSTELGEGGLFAPSDPSIDVDIDYYHVGLLWYWHAGRTRPFVVTSLGITNIDPDLEGIRSDDRFSASLGAGVKVDINRHLAIRFELRGVWTDTSDDHWWDDDWSSDGDDHWWDDSDWSHDCDSHHDCGSWNGWQDLVQGEAKVGLVLSF